QAEDGIRDRTVTGVQTCALPISSADLSRRCVLRNQPSSARETPSPCNTPVKSDLSCRCSGCRERSRLALACEVTIAEFLSSKRKIGRASCRESGETKDMNLHVKR